MPDSAATAIVIIGGDAPPLSVLSVLPAGALVIAADSGVDHALGLGLRIDLVVGDLDSVTPDGLRRAEAAGARVERHPTDKDATDAELAIDAAVAAGCDRVVVVSGGGGRLDHLLGSVALLGRGDVAADVEGWIGTAHVVVLRGPASTTVDAPAGSIVSLVPLASAIGVTTSGLRWPLDNEPLLVGTTRGVSNEVLTTPATVTVRDGVLAVVSPEALEAAL